MVLISKKKLHSPWISRVKIEGKLSHPEKVMNESSGAELFFFILVHPVYKM